MPNNKHEVWAQRIHEVVFKEWMRQIAERVWVSRQAVEVRPMDYRAADAIAIVLEEFEADVVQTDRQIQQGKVPGMDSGRFPKASIPMRSVVITLSVAKENGVEASQTIQAYKDLTQAESYALRDYIARRMLTVLSEFPASPEATAIGITAPKQGEAADGQKS